ncbi:RNA-directed DNA polymerase [Tanacetum coccineum]
MYTHGRKKAEEEPAPPAREPRDVETIERLQQRIQELELQQLQPDSPAEEVEIEPNIWDDEPVGVNPFGGRNHSLGLKIKITEFIGKVHSEDFIDLLSTDHVNKRRRIEGKSKVETWEKMKKLMKAKFLPENHHQEAFLDYHNMSQQNMTIEEVINEFDKLRMRCDVVKEEEQVVTWFLGVLKPKIADMIKAKSKGSNSCFTSHYTPPTRIAPPTAPKTAPKATTLTTSATEHEVDEPGDELVYPDRGEALVIQRVLNVAISKSVDDTSWLRNNIFRTKCTSKGKICDMIIDRGSCENVVSTYMVEKLGMKTEDHHEPYQLTWIKKGNTFKVSKRCLVQFSIGKKYKDEVWCEVIPMDAAHILLGRPWQFDRKTKHDGFQNTYSFKKDGVNITLVPFESRQTQADGSNLFMKKTVQPLLKEFADGILNDIPPGLPAMRDIQHCIDFIPGFAIPNRPAYQMNSKEFADYMVLLFFSKIDLRSGYHQIRMRPGDEWKTAFKIEMDCTSGCSLEQHLSHLRQIFSILRAQKLYANGKKCHFLMTEVTFMGSIIAPLTECMKGGRFMWKSKAAKAFDILKAKVTEAPVLALPNFDEVFQVECDASGVGIGGVLKFYAIVRTLDTWRRYLLSNEFVLFSDHEALKFINGQHKLKPRHAKLVEFIQAFSFVIRHKVGSDNQVANALSRGYLLLERCRTCHIAKTHSSNAGLYTPFSVPVAPWEDVSLDSVLEIVKLHGVPKTLTFDRDVKFVSHFWRTLRTRLGSVNRTTSKSPFEVVYGRNPITPLDLVPVPEVGQFSKEGAHQSEKIKELHRMLKPRGDGPFRVLKKINDNAYKIELPSYYNVSATFNVADFSPYKGDSDDEPDPESTSEST